MILTEGQEKLLKKISTWYNDVRNGNTADYKHPQWFAYSGAAGVGKTAVIKEFLNELHLHETYIGCAYTGKAVLNMQMNGLKARTIHSLIYNVIDVEKYNPETGQHYYGPEFVLKDELDYDYSLIIVDEAPMVNDEMCGEILSFGIPVVFIGDMNQLPPVFGKSSVMQNPDHVLTQIMRQREDDPIVQLSQMVLKGLPIFEGEYGKCSVVRSHEVTIDDMTNYDQILCITNKLRAKINSFMREERYGTEKTFRPQLLDKVVCRQNNWDISHNGFFLTNGTAGIITDIDRSTVARGYYLIDFHPDYFKRGEDFERLKVDCNYINSDWKVQRATQMISNEKFEYAYALTVHLSQGSEYNRVLFFDSYFRDPETTRKAEYTAITRAKELITIVRDPNLLM